MPTRIPKRRARSAGGVSGQPVGATGNGGGAEGGADLAGGTRPDAGGAAKEVPATNCRSRLVLVDLRRCDSPRLVIVDDEIVTIDAPVAPVPEEVAIHIPFGFLVLAIARRPQ